jgi:hypothetical protein
MILAEKFFSAPLDDMKRGYSEGKDYYECLLCGEKTEKGVIYSEDDAFYDAGKQIKNHISKVHGSIFDFLIGADKKYTGLSDHQCKLLRLFNEGKSDYQVQKEMGIKSSSTIRNHRFLLKEKERQAKALLVIMDILKEKKISSTIPQKPLSRVAGDRTVSKEEEEILNKFFPLGLDGPLKTFQIKEKSKIA